MAQATVVAKLQLASALLVFKKYLIKKWFFLSLAHHQQHRKLAHPIKEMNATIHKIGRDAE
jgi:hypothetical protein